LGLPEPGPHRRWGFDEQSGYLRWIERNDPTIDRRRALASGRPPAGVFWYRYSPSELIPDDVHGFFVWADDPVQHRPGEGRIRLDLEGRLLALDVVPPEPLPEGVGPADWTALFQAAGLEPAAFVEAEPVRPPTAPCDALRAWRGPVYGDLEGVVQAGSFSTMRTYFEILGPWDLEDEAATTQGTPFVAGLIIVAILVSTMVLARRNLRAGRSDRKGAIKLMVFFVLTIFGSWFVTELRLRTFAAGSLFEEMVFGRLLAHGLLHAMIAGLLYVALEPYVRRLWPETLVSWSRLLLGRLRDPLVGRDVLLGMGIVGSAAAATSWAGEQLMRWLEVPMPLADAVMPSSLTGVRYAIASLLIAAQASVVQAMLLLVALLLTRLLLRRTWAAVALLLLAGAVLAALPEVTAGARPAQWLLSVAAFSLMAGVIFACMLRLGLLSVIAAVFLLSCLSSAPLTWDLSQWYAGSGLVAVAAVLGVALWAFYTSLAGQRLFRDSVLGEP
jgi:hypothetical protein